MVGASKILTVSYGTFSCTLEGFEEPFSTMKAIAEYFRDLAADDRYFGATPPTPDADMLHRIAEREIQRKVEARISDQGIVLRPRPGTFAPAPVAMDAPTAVVGDAAPVKPSIPESVAQKLMRIRAVVSEANKVEAQAPLPLSGAVPFEEDEATEEFAAATSASDTDFGFDLDFGDMPGLKAGSSAHAAAPAEDSAAEEAEDTLAAVMAQAAKPAEEVAPDDATVAADVAEDEAFDAAEDVALVAAEAAPQAAEIAEPQDDEEGIVAFDMVADADDGMPAEAEEAAAPATDAEALPADEPQTDWAAEAEDDADQPRARVIRMNRAAADDIEDDQDDAASFHLPEEAPLEYRTAAVMAALSDTAYEDDFEDADAATDSAVEDSDILAQIGAAIGDTGLPDADEEELLRDLANVASDLRRDSHEGRAILESASEDDEASVARLMEEAKSKLEGPENRRRFSAIAHLKAAVAATVADRKMKSGDAGVVSRELPGDDTKRYRDDLSKAVRPRRPTSDSVPVTQRPTMSTRLAPLMLVSEQRVDLTDETRPDATVIRPRRISAVVADSSDDDDLGDTDDLTTSPEDARSFAEFAERLGATSLPDLLEAAAAYTSTVEGITHFSRPQIMRKVAGMAEDEDYSPEDSLRSFGMLLRQGKIQKVRRGQFMLTEASRFMDEARRAGQ